MLVMCCASCRYTTSVRDYRGDDTLAAVFDNGGFTTLSETDIISRYAGAFKDYTEKPVGDYTVDDLRAMMGRLEMYNTYKDRNTAACTVFLGPNDAQEVNVYLSTDLLTVTCDGREQSSREKYCGHLEYISRRYEYDYDTPLYLVGTFGMSTFFTFEVTDLFSNEHMEEYTELAIDKTLNEGSTEVLVEKAVRTPTAIAVYFPDLACYTPYMTVDEKIIYSSYFTMNDDGRSVKILYAPYELSSVTLTYYENLYTQTPVILDKLDIVF